jgi:PAP2 superfamily
MEAAAHESTRSIILPRFRAHETAFVTLGVGAFIALLVGQGQHSALTAEIGAGASLYYCALVALSRKEGLAGERMRLLANYLFTCWFYGATSRVTHALRTPTFDGTLLACDEWLFGKTPAVSLQPIIRPWLTDVLSICYLSYLIYLQMVVFWAFGQPQRIIQRFGASIFAGFASGFLTYLLLPALGPGGAFPSLFSIPLHGSFLTWLNDFVVTRGAAIYGTFPSLHLFMTLLLLDNDRRDCRVRFWIMLGPAIGLTVSTMYLRYHYATDLLAGVVYFFVIHAVFERRNRRA